MSSRSTTLASRKVRPLPLRQPARERFIVERRGKPVAAIISVEELEHLERMELEREVEMMRLAKTAATREGVASFETLVEQYEGLHGERLELPSDV